MEIDAQRLQDDVYRNEVLTALMRAQQDQIFRYCTARLGDVYGEEVAQEVFVTAWKNLPKFRQDAKIETWLVGIAKYKCVQAFRNRTRRHAIASTFVEDIRQQAHADAPGMSESMAGAEEPFARLAHYMHQLRDDERLLLNLRYTKALPVTEIAALVGKSDAAVRKRLLRALQHLRQMMADSASE
jgi:RNA polymerase sigma-70 factor (ECF subfamily)